MQPLIKTKLSLPLLHRGKVRDIFDIDDANMLIVATDRLSAFDVVFDQPIPEKGTVLTSIANYWFQKTEHIIHNIKRWESVGSNNQYVGVVNIKNISNFASMEKRQA